MADITGDKIRELLSDPKNIELIASIAGSGLLGGLIPKSENSDSAAPTASTPAVKELSAEATDSDSVSTALSVPEELPAVAQPPAISDIASALPLGSIGTSDKRIALLKAIKPYVSDSKKEKVDGLVKAISVAGILSGYTGGLFGNKF